MTPWWFHLSHRMRRKALRKQKIEHVHVEGLEHLGKSLEAKHGVLITPNHSFHYDSYCLLAGAEKLATPFYIMTAWQVFATSNWFECRSMQRCGCFSVDREGIDLQAMKTAVDVLQNRPHPLVIFPEGDVYHTNDRITPFRDGAAAMALMAARKAERPVVIIPTALKRWYTENPTQNMLETIAKLEVRLFWRPRIERPLPERIMHVAGGLLALKEIEHFGLPHVDSVPNRIKRLARSILEYVELRYGIVPRSEFIPERVKEVRRQIIQARQSMESLPSAEQQRQWSADMDDMFLVTQLFSYPGDYMLENPTWERLAETLDKLEEDALGAVYPSVRGSREVMVRFGEPIELPRGKEKRWTPAELTDVMESRVQSMLNEMKPNVHS